MGGWMEQQKSHWETVYEQKRPGEVSWYQPHLTVSLRLLANAGLRPDSRVIDVGGGASTLADDLLDQGVKDMTVLDISGHALAVSRARLGERAERVTWIETDITQAQFPSASYDLWHDRAVFHFLTRAEDRRQYLAAMRDALKPGGQAILATFALQGPPRCSGLDVVRYSAEMLQAELGDIFKLVEALDEAHHTPFRTVQQFVYTRFQKVMTADGSP